MQAGVQAGGCRWGPDGCRPHGVVKSHTLQITRIVRRAHRLSPTHRCRACRSALLRLLRRLLSSPPPRSSDCCTMKDAYRRSTAGKTEGQGRTRQECPATASAALGLPCAAHSLWVMPPGLPCASHCRHCCTSRRSTSAAASLARRLSCSSAGSVAWRGPHSDGICDQGRLHPARHTTANSLPPDTRTHRTLPPTHQGCG